MKFRTALIAGLCGLGSSLALAHHSGAFFSDEEVTLKGTIKEVQWTNPHSWIEIMVPDKDGKAVQWSIEMGAPTVMFRQGWTRSTLKPGDVVTLVARPMRDGRPGGNFVGVILPDGKTIGRIGGERSREQAGTPKSEY